MMRMDDPPGRGRIVTERQLGWALAITTIAVVAVVVYMLWGAMG